MHVGKRGSGDSKKSPTKCIVHGQAGKFLLTVFFFFLADRNKKQKEIFLLTICPYKNSKYKLFPFENFWTPAKWKILLCMGHKNTIQHGPISEW